MIEKHFIQILALDGDDISPIIKIVGFVFVEDKTQVVFNPSFKEYKKLHWTYHKDGKIRVN